MSGAVASSATDWVIALSLVLNSVQTVMLAVIADRSRRVRRTRDQVELDAGGRRRPRSRAAPP